MWARPRKLRNDHFVCNIEAKMDFYVKNRKNMQFSWNFLQNMLENGHSNLQTKLWVHITSNILKIIHFKNHGIAPTPPPPDLPTLKAYPTPVVGGRFGFFFAKMNGKDGAILPLGCAILITRAKILRGVVATPLGELGLIFSIVLCRKCSLPWSLRSLRGYCTPDQFFFLLFVHFSQKLQHIGSK